jgi:CelD/BcsL family acetyltransferase involved in cellulose biosynthesis
VGNLKTSFDEQRADLSPGSIVIDACIARAFELGASEFDFLGDAGTHKAAWTATVRVHASYFLFAPRAKASIVGRLKQLRGRLVTRASGAKA